MHKFIVLPFEQFKTLEYMSNSCQKNKTPEATTINYETPEATDLIPAKQTVGDSRFNHHDNLTSQQSLGREKRRAQQVPIQSSYQPNVITKQVGGSNITPPPPPPGTGLFIKRRRKVTNPDPTHLVRRRARGLKQGEGSYQVKQVDTKHQRGSGWVNF
jgi:hypothetical protein